ncbi:MAG: Monoheme Cytochrome c [candidate division Zixibacteria bacterium RBG-1]|nr:MAG: Monoheme Cytochrome c [candidate division Zixibacteria bacterium RBG-1]OGC83596.1 MAG: hypothetical protein A2V73_06490 [candidate division Zixibacteria bacterium RBG_19FT_COMBO_42_43]
MKLKELVLLILVLAISVFVTRFLVTVEPAHGTTPTGKELYQKHCASCHGADAKGVEKMAKMLKVTIRDLTKLANIPDSTKTWPKIIADGKAKMPAFNKKLKEAEVSSVIAYIHTLAPASGKSETPAAKDTTKVTK